MDEYISREAVINITAETGAWETQNRVRELPAEDMQPINQWISVEDKLPNIDEMVFVYIPKPDNHNNIEMAFISEGNDDYPYWVLRDKSQFYSTRFHYISHWMSIPEPPNEGDTNV